MVTEPPYGIELDSEWRDRAGFNTAPGQKRTAASKAAASTASFRTAVIRTLMETVPSPRASSATRQAATVALVNPGRSSWPYHAKNLSKPRL
jgi:hypothetical protein